MIDLKQIGEAMKAARVAAGLSVSSLSFMADVHPNTIANYEHGRSAPTISGLISIADALDISLDELVGRRGGAPDDQG